MVGSLNLVKTLQQTGSLPQNVNYAVKNAYILPLLAAEGAVPLGPRVSKRWEDVVEESTRSVVLVITE